MKKRGKNGRKKGREDKRKKRQNVTSNKWWGHPVYRSKPTEEHMRAVKRQRSARVPPFLLSGDGQASAGDPS